MQPASHYVRDPQTYALIGAAMEVHTQLGNGFLEAAYQQALAIELTLRHIPFQREVSISIQYKGRPLDCGYRADFVAYEEIIVETKALRKISDIERAQVVNYLKATGFTRAILLNFGAKSLEYERIVLNHDPESASSA